MSKNNAVVIVVNQAYAKYACALLNSIKSNWPNHPQIRLYLNLDVDENYHQYFSQIKGVKIIRFDPTTYEYRKLLVDNNSWFGSKSFHDTGYFILNFWNTELNDFNNLLILDADMLVLKSLDDLINQTSFIGVSAQNQRLFPVFSFEGSKIRKALLGMYYWCIALFQGILIKPGYSLNSGVILLTPLDRNRKNYSILISLLKKFKTVCPTDQEIILLWTLKKRKEISFELKYNFQIRFFNELLDKSNPSDYKNLIEKAKNDIHILHFNGIKPDHPDFVKKGWGKNRFELVELFRKYQSTL